MEASLNGPLGPTALGQGMLKIGRAPDNTLIIDDPQSSAHHAEVGPESDGSSYQITDLNSTNGTFVNEQRLAPNTPRPLQAGDVIRIGELRFTYQAGYSYAPTVAANAFNSNPTVPNQAPSSVPPTVYQQPPVISNYDDLTQPSSFAPPPPPYASSDSLPSTQPRIDYPQSAAYGQPGYPQTAGYGQPGYPQQKRSRAGLAIGLIVLLLLVVGGGIGGYVYVNRSTPEKTLQAYCTALQHNDAQGLYNTLSSTSKAQTDLSKISTELKALNLLLGGFKDCTYSNVQQKGSNATATLTLTPVRGKPLNEPIQLVDESSQWKIQDKSAAPSE